MRVAASILPGLGHLNPMVPMLQALQARGHEVEVVVPPPFVRFVEATGLPAVGVGPEWTEAGIDDVVPGWHDLDGPAQITVWLDTAVRLVPALEQYASEARPDAIVHDHFELAAWVVGERLGIPTVPFAMTVRWLDPTFLALADKAGEVDAFLERFDLPADGGQARAARWLYLDALPPSLTAALLPPVSTVRAVAHRAEDRSGGSDVPAWIEERDRARPLVYVTLGTVFNHRTDVLGRLARGAAATGAEVLLTVGHGGRAPGDLPEDVHVEEYVPQTAIYELVDAVVCHGGFGTVFGAVSHGVPVVCSPLSADQPLNAALVDGIGAGVNLATELEPGEMFPGLAAGGPAEGAVTEAVGRVLDDPAFRKRAEELAAEVDAQASPEEAAALVEQLVDV